MKRAQHIRLTAEEERRADEIGDEQWKFFQSIANIPPAPILREWPPKIRGRVVDRIRPARFMSFKDGIIPDYVRPPSDGERVVLADVLPEDLAPINRYREDLYDFCRETGSCPNSWDAAVDVLMVGETRETVLGYFDRAEQQPDGRYTVGVFVPNVPKAKAGPRIYVRTIISEKQEVPEAGYVTRKDENERRRS